LYNVSEIKCDPKEFERNQAELTAYYRTVILKLKDYTRSELGQDLTEAQCESGILNYMDEYSIECVASFASGSVVPVRGKDPLHWRFMVSSFVNYISSKIPDVFRYFVTVLTGRMLANALLASDLSGLGMKFRKTSIYVDTPLILQLLGVLGKQTQAHSKEVMRLLMDASAVLKVFSHTLEETNFVLKNAERYLEMPTGGSGNVIVTLREEGISPSDVALIRSRIIELLLEEGVRVAETPGYIEKYQIDEPALEQEMKAAGLHYRSEMAKKADINSIRSVYVLRAGASPEHVENSIALILTNNDALAKAAYAHGRKYREFKHVSPVITDFSLANIVWIKSPLKHPEIPTHLLLANCYGALKPSEGLWNRFVNELKKLREAGNITPEQHQYLRYELRVRDELMNLTLGDEQELSEQVVMQILGRHEEEITFPLKKQLEQVSADHEKALQTLSISESKIANIEKSLRAIGHLTRGLVRSILVGVAIFLLINAYQPFLAQGTANTFWRYVSGIFGILLIALNVANLVFGFRIINPVDSFCSFLEVRLIASLRKIIGLKIEEINKG
jgi:hypothetical protein